jgi:hypothetical protein
VKLEAAESHLLAIRELADAGVAVMAHLGLRPQAVGVLGGYRAQGRTAVEAGRIVELAVRMQEHGSAAILLVFVGGCAGILGAEYERAGNGAPRASGEGSAAREPDASTADRADGDVACDEGCCPSDDEDAPDGGRDGAGTHDAAVVEGASEAEASAPPACAPACETGQRCVDGECVCDSVSCTGARLCRASDSACVPDSAGRICANNTGATTLWFSRLTTVGSGMPFGSGAGMMMLETNTVVDSAGRLVSPCSSRMKFEELPAEALMLW